MVSPYHWTGMETEREHHPQRAGVFCTQSEIDAGIRWAPRILPFLLPWGGRGSAHACRQLLRMEICCLHHLCHLPAPSVLSRTHRLLQAPLWNLKRRSGPTCTSCHLHGNCGTKGHKFYEKSVWNKGLAGSSQIITSHRGTACVTNCIQQNGSGKRKCHDSHTAAIQNTSTNQPLSELRPDYLICKSAPPSGRNGTQRMFHV